MSLKAYSNSIYQDVLFLAKNRSKFSKNTFAIFAYNYLTGNLLTLRIHTWRNELVALFSLHQYLKPLFKFTESNEEDGLSDCDPDRDHVRLQ